ncbi:MAG TPA: GGDEF domain-containing protein [Acidimicrobiales bacterium]
MSAVYPPLGAISRGDGRAPLTRALEHVPIRPLSMAAVAVTAGFMLLMAAGELEGRAQLAVADLAPVAVGSLAVAATVLAARSQKGLATARTWWFISAALAAWLAGDITWAVIEVGLDLDPFPSPADAAYMAFYPLLLVGLGLLPTVRRTRRERLRLTLDAATVFLGTALAVWYLVLGPAVPELDGFTGAAILSIAYPVFDVLLLFAVVAVLLRGVSRAAARPLHLLLAGTVAFVLADLSFAKLDLTGSYSGVGFPDHLWVVAMAIMTMAADVQRGVPADPPVTERRHVAERVAVAPYAAVAISGVLLVNAVRGFNFYPIGGLVLGGLGLTALVVARQILAMLDVRRLMTEFERLASTDALTGLASRRSVLAIAEEVVTGARRETSPVTLLMIDLDDFKKVNDTHGHAAGDAALGHIARLFRATLRERDLVGRYGGDELLVVLPDTDLTTGVAVAERLRKAVRSQPLDIGGVVVPLSLSVGVAVGTQDGDLDAVLSAADAGLLMAKRAGRDCVRIGA